MSNTIISSLDSSEQNYIQLYGTDSLCFNKNDFMKKDFNVDTFVQIHQASGSGGLELLRDDLGVYLKILRSAMIDLINRDYADFVNLSTNLTGLDRHIEALKTPLGQLKEEVLSVEQLLSDAINSVSSDLARRHAINQQKSFLHRINQISIRLDRLEVLLNCGGSSLPSLATGDPSDSSTTGNDLVDRLATEVNHLNFLVAQCEGASLLDLFKPRVEAVCSFVEVGLERGLREGIQGADAQLLLRTLRTYASLGTIQHAHQQVRAILRTHLEDVMSESALKSDPRGLHGMFEKALATIRKVCDPLLAVSLGTGSDIVPGYSFLECSAWPEIVHALETRTPNIFSPGNPSLFLERYKQSMDFMTTFEKLLNSNDRIQTFRNDAQVQHFLDQWNLPVYFQIRYKEIGQVMEANLLNPSLPLSPPRPFRLTSTQGVWESLVKCFDAEVFLLPLLHRFWKLALLILARHREFIATTTATMKSDMKSSEKAPPKGPSPPTSGPSPASPQENTLQEAVFLLGDIQALCDRLQGFYSSSIRDHVEHLSQDKKELITDTLLDQCAKHRALKSGLLEFLTQHLSGSTSSHLKQVSDTPRIYRRTNKPLPSTHQSYIANAFLPLSAFYEMSKGGMCAEDVKEVVKNVFVEVCRHYHGLTYEVLSSVHKMEESLRRLKRARERGAQSGVSSSGTASDDDKIRTQIHLDVLYFGEQFSSYQISASEVEPYSQLVQMVESAKEGKFTP